jgi:cell division protein FtsI (penicillin-binding protein 3)
MTAEHAMDGRRPPVDHHGRTAGAAPSLAYRPSRWVKVRLYASSGILVALFAALGYRAYVLQVREANHLRAMAEDQYLKDVELPPRRGRILDRNGAELAASAEVESIYCNPRQLGNRATELVRSLAGPLRMDRRELDKRLHNRRYFSWVKRRVDPDEAAIVRELQVPGLALAREPRRYYPNRGLAGPVLGWAGLDAVGQEGLELEYDRFLRGARAQVPGLRDALGRAVLISGVGDLTPQGGLDVETTIDRYVQFRLEHSLEEAVQKHRAKAGTAVALDPKTGDVLAMAAVPSLNPNDPADARDRGARNRAVTDPFEPGSTMKTFSITGALEAGVIKVDEHWFCENGRYMIGPAQIHDAHPVGDATTTEVLAKSSNICTAKIAAREGRERLRDVLLRFGFGRPTGIDLPGERAGQLRSVPHMGPVETATMSFGQGLTATPLQMAAAYAAIANGGVWVRPHVLRRVVDGQGMVREEPAIERRRVIDESLARTMRGMLEAVTQKGGSAEKLSIPGYRFAGKTGTAQKVDPMTRRYSTDRWASSFVGFAPATDPRLVIFVMVDEPEGSHYGSLVAGPVFQEVMIDALRWLGVPPDPDAPPSAAEVKLAEGKAGTIAKKEKARAEPVPSPTPSDEGAAAGDDEAVDDAVAGRTEVPDFTGMSIAEALDAARRAGLHLEVSGSGFAAAQSPGPGAGRRGAACRVSFSPPG